MVRHKAEEGRVAVRNLRRASRHELEALEKDGVDLLRRARPGREGAREDHPRPGGRDRPAPGPQGKGAPRGVTMDDERTDSDDEQESSRPGRVRIFGAEVAGRTGEVPAVPGGVEPGRTSVEPEQASWTDPPAVPAGPVPEPAVGADDPLVADQDRPAADHWPEPDLPHWTEAPTGEVPAVLSARRRRRGRRRRSVGGHARADLAGGGGRLDRPRGDVRAVDARPRRGPVGLARRRDQRPPAVDLRAAALRRDHRRRRRGGASRRPGRRLRHDGRPGRPAVHDPVRPVDDGAPSTVAGSTVFPETGDAWAPAPAPVAAAADEAGDRQPPPVRRPRPRSVEPPPLAARSRRARGPAVRRRAVRAPRLDARPLVARPLDEGGSTGDAPTADRTDAQDAAAAVAPEGRIGEPVPVRPPPAPASLGGTGRPVPKAPSGPRRPPPRQRPGMGLRPRSRRPRQ